VRTPREIAVSISVLLAVLVAALLIAAALNVGMAGAYLHPTPRVNSMTVGLGLVPFLALSLTAVVWLPPRKGAGGVMLLRVLGTIALLGVGAVCGSMSLFLAFFVG
jgi:hypothetical protein